MQEIILFFLTAVFLIAAAYTDLKKRIIPNKLVVFFFVLFLFYQILYGLFEGKIYLLEMSLLVLISTFVGTFILYALGVWAAGDVKLFSVVALANPFNYGIIRDFLCLNSPMFMSVSQPYFPLTLFLFSLFVALPFGAVIGLKELRKNKKLREKIKSELIDDSGRLLWLALCITGIYFILGNYFETFMLVAVSAICVMIIFKLPKNVKRVVIIALFVASVLISRENALISFIEFFFAMLVLYILIDVFVRHRREMLAEKRKITQLKEGEILGESVVKQGGKFVRSERVSFRKAVEKLLNGNVKDFLKEIKQKGEVIVSGKKACGVSEREIKLLKKLVKERKLKNEILVKQSTAFAPNVLIAYIILQIIGDFIWIIML